MCKFCDLLYSKKQADSKLHNEVAADLVYFDDGGELNIQVDTGDPWESGILSDITYCHFCGRNLKELYGPFIRGVMKEKRINENNTVCKNFELNDRTEIIGLNCDICKFDGHCDVKNAYEEAKRNRVASFEFVVDKRR